MFSKEEEKLKLIEEEKRIKLEAEEKLLQEQMQKEEALKRQIQQALNEQTYEQFRNYADQQYPGKNYAAMFDVLQYLENCIVLQNVSYFCN